MRSSFILLFATAIAVRLPLPKSPRARILKAELTEAWLEESKAGLVQMLRENHPWVEQSRAVFTMLAAYGCLRHSKLCLTLHLLERGGSNNSNSTPATVTDKPVG